MLPGLPLAVRGHLAAQGTALPTCVGQEIEEGTGLVAAYWEPLLQTVYLSNFVTDEWAAVFLACGLTEGGMTPEASEALWVITTPLKDTVAAVLDGRITDSLTVAGS